MNFKYFSLDDGSEISLYVFNADLTEFNELSEFGYACAEKGYKNDAELLKEHAKKYGYEYIHYSWGDYLKNYISEPSHIITRLFLKKREHCVSGIDYPFPKITENNIKEALIFQDEWNDILVVAKLTESYVGYWWQTTV